MASDSEDLEFNPFYQALQSQPFLPLYEHAQQHCWLVCIPRATSLTGCPITKQFIEMHLLEPSVMFRDRYQSVLRGQKVTWHMQGNTIHSLSENGTITATVLTEELAYNKALRQFKIFILDRPLDPEYRPSRGSNRIQDWLRVRRTFQEQRGFLWSFQQHRQPMTELDDKIASFLRHYMIVETESLLQDTAAKLRTIANRAATSFLEVNSRDPRMSDRRVRDVVWLAVEGYLLASVHSKVYPAICGLHKRQEESFTNRCRRLRDKLTPKDLGLSSEYQCAYHKTLRELNKLGSIKSPLEGLYTFQDALDKIMEDVRDHFTKSLRLGEPPPMASDDLISLLASIIIQMDSAHLLSSLYYMEHFHWSLSDADRLSFSLVTLRAAVEYIRGPDVEKLLPRPDDPQKSKVLSRVPGPMDSSSRDTGDSWSSLNSIAAGYRSHEETRGDHREEGVVSEEVPKRERKKEEKKKTELGPFLSMLMSSETMTSSSFYSTDSLDR